MNRDNRNYNDAFNRRNDDYGVYGSGEYDANYYHEPGRDLRGSRSYGSYPEDRGNRYYDRERHRNEMRHDDDRNVFERMGDTIRDKWNQWTDNDDRNERYDRDRYDNRYDWMNRDRTRPYHGNYYRAGRDQGYSDRGYAGTYHYDNRRDDRNFFERAGDAMRDFFRAPNDENYREYDGRQNYGRMGYGNYAGNYGSYTGNHGLTGYNTGNESRDNYTTDYNMHYREPGYDNSYRRDDVYNRHYGRAYRRRYDY